MTNEAESPMLRLRQIQALLIVVAREVADTDTGSSSALLLIVESLGELKEELERLLRSDGRVPCLN